MPWVSFRRLNAIFSSIQCPVGDQYYAMPLYLQSHQVLSVSCCFSALEFVQS